MGIFDRFKSKNAAAKQQNLGQDKSQRAMGWFPLMRTEQIEDLVNQSHEKTVFIFKHSTRCIISSMVLRNLESNTEILAELGQWAYLDLIAHRECSNQVAQHLGVVHQSPQLIALKNGSVIWEASHQSIQPEAIVAALANA